MQTTIQTAVSFSGVALHAGATVTLCVRPAAADTGIVFERLDLAMPRAARRVLVSIDALIETNLCTRIGNAHGVTVSTIEHLMAALAGCGIHNALITLDGPEVPILDGSARPFVDSFLRAGIRRLAAPLAAIRVLRPVEVRMGDARARLDPAPELSIAFEIDFPDRAIGRQVLDLSLRNGAFVRELSDSRTFCRQSDVETMRTQGLALGGTYENAVVVSGARVLSPGGLRHPDEPVRHKMLDAMGDLAVAGAPILGRYTGHRAGHTLTGRLVRALLADPANYERMPVDAKTAAILPGIGIDHGALHAAA
ncbi:UDP-3-O-acyl-N-acetylglucosamine deacetylase [Pararhodobacter sp. SW119]|uniref:UDP-3-O-acyl-N-acetylglucosamine deacetylase n=1 Tax=Pararhodobacter sp. SW119 TaxID=2780075 RepID=UPI001AE04AD6